MCAVAGLVGEIGGPVRGLPGGFVLAELITFAILTPFVWWTIDFLLAGRVPWRTLFPAAVATAIFALLLGAFSRVYFSSTVIADDRTYGAIGAVFSLMTWLTAVGAVIILGAVAGGVGTSDHRVGAGSAHKRRSLSSPSLGRGSTGDQLARSAANSASSMGCG